MNAKRICLTRFVADRRRLGGDLSNCESFFQFLKTFHHQSVNFSPPKSVLFDRAADLPSSLNNKIKLP